MLDGRLTNTPKFIPGTQSKGRYELTPSSRSKLLVSGMVMVPLNGCWVAAVVCSCIDAMTEAPQSKYDGSMSYALQSAVTFRLHKTVKLADCSFVFVFGNVH